MLQIEKEHKKSTLMSMKKEELVKHIMFLEHNNNVLHETLNQQAINCERLLNNKWIPCGERMPKTNGVYDVTRKIVEGEYKFYISDSAYFDGQNTWHADNRVNHGREYLKDVVAWMELPEPYKEP